MSQWQACHGQMPAKMPKSTFDLLNFLDLAMAAWGPMRKKSILASMRMGMRLGSMLKRQLGCHRSLSFRTLGLSRVGTANTGACVIVAQTVARKRPKVRQHPRSGDRGFGFVVSPDLRHLPGPKLSRGKKRKWVPEQKRKLCKASQAKHRPRHNLSLVRHVLWLRPVKATVKGWHVKHHATWNRTRRKETRAIQ